MTQQCDPTTPSLLLVDTSLEHQKLLSSLAKQMGMSTTSVASCAEAMQALASSNFDVILMDWTLPDMNALACTELIRELQVNSGLAVPIIGCTARNISGAREKCLQAGMDDYIAKPFTLPQLKAVLEKWLALT